MKTKLTQKIKEEFYNTTFGADIKTSVYSEINWDLVWNFIEKAISQSKEELLKKFLDDLGYAYIHDKNGRKNIKVLIGLYNIKLEDLNKK